MTVNSAGPAHTPAFTDAPTDLRRMAVILATAAAGHVRVRRRELGVGGGHAEGTDLKSSRVDPVTVVDRESEQLIRDRGVVEARRCGSGEFGAGPGGVDEGQRGPIGEVEPTTRKPARSAGSSTPSTAR